MELETITTKELSEKKIQVEVKLGKETIRGDILYDESTKTCSLYPNGKKQPVLLQTGQTLICGNEAYILG